MQTYKQVVTHYLAAKMEIWMSKFMAPVYGVTGGNVSFEFAKSRGAIHYHSVLYSKHPGMLRCADALRDYAVAISNAMATVNKWIDDTYSPAQDGKSFPANPSSDFSPRAAQVRADYCNSRDEGKEVWA